MKWLIKANGVLNLQQRRQQMKRTMDKKTNEQKDRKNEQLN